MRGEYPVHRITSMRMWGSPPHAWRIHYPPKLMRNGIRITSTCVENTEMVGTPIPDSWDHLHMRGEYSKQIPL